jgi:hypothetical protein
MVQFQVNDKTYGVDGILALVLAAPAKMELDSLMYPRGMYREKERMS